MQVIQILSGYQTRRCRNYSCGMTAMEYVMLHYQYIFSIVLSTVKNRPLFNTNPGLHNFITRTSHDLHRPTANLTLFRKGVCYSGVKIYNYLPSTLKQLSYDVNKFKMALRGFLLANSFYSLKNISAGNK
jgi:hypothetical protein